VKEIFVIHCLQLNASALGNGRSDGRVFNPCPGAFLTVEEAEHYCAVNGNKNLVCWYTKVVVGKMDIRAKLKSKKGQGK